MEILENRVTWEAAFTAGWLRHYQTTGQINWDLYNQFLLPKLSRPYVTKTPVGRREPICQDFVAKTLAVTRHNLPRHFSQVSADDVGFGLQAAQHLAGAGDKGGGATGVHGASNVPIMGGDQTDIGDSDA